MQAVFHFVLDHHKMPELDNWLKERSAVSSEEELEQWHERGASLRFADPFLRLFEDHELNLDHGHEYPLRLFQGHPDSNRLTLLADTRMRTRPDLLKRVVVGLRGAPDLLAPGRYRIASRKTDVPVAVLVERTEGQNRVLRAVISHEMAGHPIESGAELDDVCGIASAVFRLMTGIASKADVLRGW
ncbi:MAG: hypothetical protein WC802_04340 [Patescibacteria group bacterium]|jgi:hypothetical protein